MGGTGTVSLMLWMAGWGEASNLDIYICCSLRCSGERKWCIPWRLAGIVVLVVFLTMKSGCFVWKILFIDAAGPACHPGYVVDKVRARIDFGAYTDYNPFRNHPGNVS